MNKHMTQEVAIKSAWMILEGLGFSREINGDLEKTVAAVFESAPAADVVEVTRCKDCVHGEHYYGGVSCRMPSFPEWKVHEKDYFCADGKRKDGGQDDA